MSAFNISMVILNTEFCEFFQNWEGEQNGRMVRDIM